MYFAKQSNKSENFMYSYLALGDSYTIGELVDLKQNFPFQLVKQLNNNNIPVSDPVIIAKTGWTTDELMAAIQESAIQETFSFVTLLIGVNNQYRGRSVENYSIEFKQLLQQAIQFAGDDPKKVFVLSIPDWGVTPFAKDKNASEIATAIDQYNDVNKNISLAEKCHYLYITDSTRLNAIDAQFLAEDGLHPSAKEYAIWIDRLLSMVVKNLIS